MLVVLFFHDVDDMSIQWLIPNSFSFDSWEEIVDKHTEKRNIFKDELWHVHISQSSHQHDIFREISVASLELTSHDQDGLECSQTEIIMVLLWELFFTQLIKSCHLFGKWLSLSETFRHEHVFTNELQIRCYHSNRSEEGFEIIWQLWSSSITWVHRNEDTNTWNKSHLNTEEVNHFLFKDKTILNLLDLSWNDWEYLNINSVELIEATPKTCLDKTREDDSHCNIIKCFTTVCYNTS